MKTRIAIAGYGNLGRGVEAALKQNCDMGFVHLDARQSFRYNNYAPQGVG